MKHKDKETQQKREAKQERKKTDLLLFLSSWVVGLSLGETLPGTKGQKKHYETRVCVVSSFLFVGVLLGKLTTRTITITKLRKQDNKTTRQQKTIHE